MVPVALDHLAHVADREILPALIADVLPTGDLFEHQESNLVAAVEKLKVGDGVEAGVTTGPLINRAAVDKVIAAIDDLDAVTPNRVDFVEFMMHLSGNAAEMDGTAVTADELWSLPEVVAELKNLPNGGRFDHRYIEAEADAEKELVPTVVSAGGFAVAAADW